MTFCPLPGRFRSYRPKYTWAARKALFGSLAALLMFAADIAAQVGGAIAVYPENSKIEVGSSRQFSAYVPISPNTVTWSVNDIPGGSSAFGTISPSGLYQAPTVAPSNNVVTIKATSTAYPSSFGSATLTITRKYPWLWGVSPSSLVVGSYSVSFNGSNFAPDSQALANGVPVDTTYSSPTRLLVKGIAATAGPLKFSVRQPGNGAVTGNEVTVQVAPSPITVSLSPGSATVNLNAAQAFTATVNGTTNVAVTWTVNGIAGGSSTVGTITASGLYTAPEALPANTNVSVRATSVANPAAFAQATVALVAPLPAVTVAVNPGSASVQLGHSQQFTATVTGDANTAVVWQVNGVTGGSALLGTISASGYYTAPGGLPGGASNVTIRARSAANPNAYAQAVVTLQPVPIPVVSLSAARFLEQSSFGPTPATLARVQQLGFAGYLDEQIALPETAIPLPADNSMGALRQWALHNYTSAPDQLRQRVIYALSQIVVTSANKLNYPNEMVPWMRALSKHAFGNYKDLLRDVTKSPSMGKYLDLANSMKPGIAGGANENYPRELLQLFTIGLWKLKTNGLPELHNNQPISAYDQETVRQVALALTGWTYPTAPGATPQNVNWENFTGPMEPRQQWHATEEKNFLGCTLPAGQTVEQDLEGVLDCLMQHPNIAPFIATRLIRSLVTSNPSPEYVERIALVFIDNGHGERGDLEAVVRAILLDPEARNDNAGPDSGRLKEPILQTAGLLRALNGGFTSAQQITYMFDYMGQAVLAPPSVFSWFSPLYRLPESSLFAPEFQIYSPTEATLRGNLFHHMLTSGGGDMMIDVSPFAPYGNDMPSLVEAANQILLYGRMPDAMKQALITAASPGYDAKTRIQTVLYLTALSGQHAIQH
ncbi:MAG TPA: DUF1800 family protein [Methylomirabilota bacterium]|nr:DUF1800 family protein [Methylomirabilota bacterium]